ncbi:MAG: 50S ribosomal protein L40e [Candidatus Micrarchaeia archaeon]
MGKFAVADAQLMSVKICKRCKARNSINSTKCRKCGYTALRMKNKVVKRKK